MAERLSGWCEDIDQSLACFIGQQSLLDSMKAGSNPAEPSKRTYPRDVFFCVYFLQKALFEGIMDLY